MTMMTDGADSDWGKRKRSTQKTNLTQCHFAHQKSHVDYHWFEHGPPQREAEC